MRVGRLQVTENRETVMDVRATCSGNVALTALASRI